MNRTRKGLIAVGLTAAGVFTAQAAGFWATLPIVGGASFCASTVSGTGSFGGVTGQGQGSTGSICAATVPAGPTAITGNETFPVDTNLTNGASPQSARIPVALLASYVQSNSLQRNFLRNGDTSVNPFQRGTSNGTSHISNTLTYGPDGFSYLGGASSSIDWSKQTGATDIVTGQFLASMRFQRTSANADTAKICQYNVSVTSNSIPLAGQNFVYSFFEKVGANFSAASNNIVVTVAYGTGTDQSAASFAAGTWTGFTVAATQTITTTTTMTQYAVSGSIPATATQVGASICWTPVGTAGANDWIETANHQLEVVGPSVTTPSAFEHKPAPVELLTSLSFYVQINEGATSVRYAGGQAYTTTSAHYFLAFPYQMRAAPTVTATVGTFSATVAAGTQQVCTALAATTSSATVNGVDLTCTVAANLVAGSASQLEGGGGTGSIALSAEL